jgi:protein SCO1/2
MIRVTHRRDRPQARERVRRTWKAVAGLAAVALCLPILSACGGESSAPRPTPAGQSEFAGTALTPVQSAPSLALRNYLGDPVNLDQYRGKAVLVTFLYTHCIDVCPVIAANLAVALDRLGPHARAVQIIAVSVDPRGDNRKTVAAFLRSHHMTGRMKYLIGTAAKLRPVWKAWHVAAVRDSTSRKLVTHTSVTYGVSATGKLITLYGPSFQPAQIVHDIPGLITSQ